MSEPNSNGEIRFGAFEVIPSRGELRKHGIRIKLGDQSFTVLLVLLENPGAVVSREELRRRLWGDDTFTDFEHGLNAAVNRLRDALGDAVNEPKFIETLPKRGYRFVAQVNGGERVPESPVPVEKPKARLPKWNWAAGAMAGPVLSWKATAVLSAILAGSTLAVVMVLLRQSEPPLKPSMRFSITLPADAPLAPSGLMPLGQDRPTLSISPDGNRLAYVAQVGETTQICMRDMLSGKVEPLPETQGGHSPFFSPDGASIGFFADGKLKKTSSTGGPVLSLADAPQPFGGVWGSDGFIYFNRMSNEGIHKIRADGNAVEGVTKGVVSMPELLYAAQGLLATSADAIVHVDGAAVPRRLIAGFGARHARSGHLAYATQGKLMAVGFDPSSVQVIGAPVSMFGDLRTASFGVAQFAIAQNGTLIYVPGHSANLASFVWVDRTGKARPAGLPERQYLPFDLSPDGRQLAFGLNTGDFEEAEIWVHDWQKGATSRLTPRSEDGRKAMHLYPRWTPDGRNIVHFVRQDGKRRLLLQPTDGSAQEADLWRGRSAGSAELVPFYMYPTSFAPDGSTMMVFGLTAERSMDIFTMRLDRGFRPPAGEPELFLGTPFAEAMGQISPDGQWVVYASDQTGRWEIYVTSYPKPGATYLVSRGNGGHKPIWNPAAPEILYRHGTKIYAVDVTLNPDFRAGAPRLLFEGPYPNIPGSDWDIAPDGKEFLLLENKDVLKPVTTLTVVTNFLDELRRRVPPDGGKQ